MKHSIELDCAPGTARPDAHYPGVIKDTGLPERKPASKFFGNWTWDYSDIDDTIWDNLRPLLKERITKLYHAGYIRYGNWS